MPGTTKNAGPALPALPKTARANQRILNRIKPKVDTSHVEAASISRTLRLSSGEAKRLFLRFHVAFSVATNYIVSVGRKVVEHQHIDKIETEIRGLISQARAEISNATLQAERLFREKHIERSAQYRTDVLEIDVDIISSLSREYLEAFQAFDALMPLIETLEIEGVINSARMEDEKSRLKRRMRRVASAARMFETATRKKVAETKELSEAERLQGRRRRSSEEEDDLLQPLNGDGDALTTPVLLDAPSMPDAASVSDAGQEAVESEPVERLRLAAAAG